MLLLPTVLCIVLFSPCSTTFDEKAELVNAAVKALTTATTGSADGLWALDLFGQQAASLMKAVVPIGAIIAETPQSEEHKALMDFKKRLDVIWNDAQSRIDNSTSSIGAEITKTHYLVNVDLPIRIMKNLTDEYIDPTMYKSDTFINGYRRECYVGDNSPQSILTYLHHRLVTTCSAVTPTEAQAIADHRAYLMRIFLRLRVEKEPLPDPGLYFSKFLAIYAHLGSKRHILYDDLDVFKRYFASYRKAVQAFFEELQDQALIGKVENDEFLCFLRSLINKSYFNYRHIEAFVLELKKQLIDVTFLAGICANLYYEGHAESIDKHTMKIAEEVALISSYTSRCLKDSLISAWPSAHNEILKEQLMRVALKPGKVDDRNLKIVADLTHPILINTGLPNHVYEMLIVRAEEEQYEHYFEGISNYCSLNKGAFGFDTVIGRIHLNSTNQQETFKVDGRMPRLTNDADELNITIQYEMNELYDAATLPAIADTLKKKIAKEFITQHDFHCWAIVREWSRQFWNSCPTIDSWSSSYNSVDLSSITTLSYRNKGTLYEHCEEFRFFFFV